MAFFVMISLTVLIPLRRQWVAQRSVADAALHLLAMTLGIPAAAFVAGRYMYTSGQIRPLQRLGVVLVPLALTALSRLLGGAIGVAVLSSVLWTLLRAGMREVESGGLEAIVHLLQVSPATLDTVALDRSFRSMLWLCLAWWLPDTRLGPPARR